MDVGVYLSTTRITDVERACAAVRELGFEVVQLGKLADEYYTPLGAERLGGILRRAGLTASALGMVYDGEIYATPETVRRTVGFLPPDTAEARVVHSQRCIGLAASGAPTSRS